MEERIQETIKSYAKVNLFLHVKGKRDDGFHGIESLFQRISLHDAITVTMEDGDKDIEISSDSKDMPLDSKNLMYEACEKFFKETGIKNKKVRINIIKNIPISAGLGGGSSNAATVLMSLNRLCDEPLTIEKIKEIALSIGSDVPFFLLHSSALAKGRGEVLIKADLPNYHYLLVNPNIHISAKEAYESLNLTKEKEDNIIFNSNSLTDNPYDIKSFLRNDLEDGVFKKYPHVKGLKEEMIKTALAQEGTTFLGALMSGSGSTVFGLFTKESHAQDVLNKLKSSLNKDYFYTVAKGL